MFRKIRWLIEDITNWLFDSIFCWLVPICYFVGYMGLAYVIAHFIKKYW